MPAGEGGKDQHREASPAVIEGTPSTDSGNHLNPTNVVTEDNLVRDSCGNAEDVQPLTSSLFAAPNDVTRDGYPDRNGNGYGRW